MENYQMNRAGCRPYNRTCGMMKLMPIPEHRSEIRPVSMSEHRAEMRSVPMPEHRAEMRSVPLSEHRAERKPARGDFASKTEDCSCKMPGIKSKDAEMYSHLSHLEMAMAYVPCQKFTDTFDLMHALHMGTIFPELCKPFCGKRGGRR